MGDLNHRVKRFNETQTNILKDLDKMKNTKKTAMVVEKKTGDRYPSKAVMMKHEKGESKTVQKNEEKKFAAKKVAVKKLQGRTPSKKK